MMYKLSERLSLLNVEIRSDEIMQNTPVELSLPFYSRDFFNFIISSKLNGGERR